MQKNVMIPKIRFKEFTGPWKRVALGKFSNIKTGPFGSTLHQEDYVQKGTPIVTVEHLSDFGLVHKNLPRVSAVDKARLKSYVLLENDIVFSRVGSVDRNSLIKHSEAGWLFSGRLLRIRIEYNSVNPSYLSKVFQTDRTKYNIRSVAVGQTMPSLNTEILKNFEVNLSQDIKEQQKIAAFLTTVEDKIQNLSKKKALLERYKKGIIQQIFSKEIRFKDDEGNDYSNWEDMKLPKVGEIISGGTPETYVEKYWGGEIEWFTPTELKSKYLLKSKRQITKEGLMNSSAKLLPKGTVLITSRATVGDVSIALSECCTNQGFQSVVVNKLLLGEYLYYWLKHNRHQLIKRASGSTFLEINKSEMSKIKIDVPSLPEQAKIATFLSSIDDKISQVNQQLELTKLSKKGLLQQMFV